MNPKLKEFKLVVIGLLQTVAAGNTETQKYKALAIEASDKATALAEQFEAYKVAAEGEKAGLLQQLSDQAAEVDQLTTELQELINPSLPADLVSDAVKSSGQIETPPVVDAATEVGAPVETPPAVVAAAIDAIETAADAVTAE